MKEIWKPARYRGQETDALISNMGNVRFKDPEYAKKHNVPIRVINRHYFARIHINNKRVYASIGRLVAIAFVPIPKRYLDCGLTEDDLEADHVHADRKDDNSVNNIQWLTPYENKEKAAKNNEHVYCGDRPNTNITNKQVKKVCKMLEENIHTIQTISALTSVPKDTIYHIRQHDIWTKISDNYDIDNYTVVTGRKYSQERIHAVCKLLEQGTMTLKEIEQETGVTSSLISNIRNKYRWRSISRFYNF